MIRKFIFMLIVLILCFSTIPEVATGQDAKVEREKETPLKSVATKDQKALCKEVAVMVSNGSIKKYVLHGENCKNQIDLRCTEYDNLDIDGDGKEDKITVSSGSDESYLKVQLSNGDRYDLGEGKIMLIKLRGQIFALVTYWDTSVTNWEIVGNRLYLLDKTKAKSICGTDFFKRR